MKKPVVLVVMDGVGEQCSLGLRQLDAQPKPVYELFRVIDTQQGSKAAEPYAKTVGERKWSSVFRGLSKKQTEPVKLYSAAGEAVEPDVMHAESELLLDFTDRNLHGFTPSDYMASAEVLSVTGGSLINTSILSAVTHPMAQGQVASVTASVSDLTLPETAETLYVMMMADAAAEVQTAEDGTAVSAPIIPQSVTVQLQLYRDGEDDVRWIGEATLDVGTWTAVGFDIKDYARAASGMDVMRLSLVGGTGDPDITYTLSVNEIRYETGAGLIVLRVFLWVLLGLLVIVVIFAVLVIRAQIIRRRRRRQRAAQRAAYLARQRQLRSRQLQQTQAPGQKPQAYRTSDGRTSQTQEDTNARRRDVQRRPDMYRNNRR